MIDLLDSIHDDITFLDRDLKVVWSNWRHREKSIWSGIPEPGQCCHEIIAGRLEPCAGCPVPEVLRTGGEAEGVVNSPDGGVCRIMAAPVHDELGNIVVRVAVPDDLDALIDRDLQAFSGTFTVEERVLWREMLDLKRFRVAYDGGDLVGVAGSHELELTLPGGAVVPLGGTTWVSVAPTHRRRGIVTRLMAEVHSDIESRGGPIAGLVASEGGGMRAAYWTAAVLGALEDDTANTTPLIESPGAATMPSDTTRPPIVFRPSSLTQSPRSTSDP